MSDHLPGSPLVSIVTPVLNGAKYLELCIQSVLAQSYPNIEQIFVDGGSTDGTLEMLASYQSRYPGRIRFVSEPDEGVGDALNRGLKMAKGDIFGWLDSDDLYEPDAITTVVSFFQTNPDAYFVFGECDIINEKGEITGKRQVKDWNLREAVTSRHYVIICAAFYKREVIEKAGYFNTLGNDLDFWVRVGKAFQLNRIEAVLGKNRVHKTRISVSSDPHAVNEMRKRYREDYIICRQYGASIFAPICRRYYIFVVLDKLGIRCFANDRILPLLQRYPLTRKLLRIAGI